MKTKKKRCWSCDSLSTICWEKRNNKQRYKCNNCGLLFTSKNEGVKLNNHFIWFGKWIVGKQNLEQLSLASGYSKRKLQNILYSYLSSPPKFIIKEKSALHLMIDGKYFNGDVCLILY